MNPDAINNSCTADESVPVCFEYTNPNAKSVCVAGCFNQWNPESGRLDREYGGHWVKESSLAPGQYEYRLVVDGEWQTDPQNQASVENPYGGRNSVMTVSRTEEAAHRVNAEKARLESNQSPATRGKKSQTKQTTK